MHTSLRLNLPHPLILRTSLATMAASIALPSSISLNSSSFSGLLNGAGAQLGVRNLGRSRVSMAASVGSQTLQSDALFADYKPSSAFLFPGQGAQAVGMGKEAQSVPAAAELYKKANDILG
ncbi:hypothetical protein ACFX10_005905 [Malus domestica]